MDWKKISLAEEFYYQREKLKAKIHFEKSSFEMEHPVHHT